VDHPYTAIARRLKRANGHLETIIEMIEQDRPCAQIAQQLQAVENAIESAKKVLIHDHVSQSLERSFAASGSKGRAALRDFKLIAKYLWRYDADCCVYRLQISRKKLA
jgi:DNA-binding FrmR family transcriptional regulator